MFLKPTVIIGGIFTAILLVGGCTQSDQQQIQNIANITCNAAAITAAAAVAITADINATAQSHTDAVTAQKIAQDACNSISKIPTVSGLAPKTVSNKLRSGKVKSSISTHQSFGTPDWNYGYHPDVEGREHK